MRLAATIRRATVALSLACLTAGTLAAEITAGPVVGNVTDKSARIWLQTSTGCEISVDCYELKGVDSVCSLTTEPRPPSPFTADIPLSNLEPNKAYRIEIKLDKVPVTINGPQCVIRTNPPEGAPAPATVAFGSCMDVGNGGAMSAPIFKAVDDVKPRAFLFLGNTVYLPEPFPSFERNGVANGRLAYRFIADHYSAIRKMPELQNLFRTVACYGAWNDRDFGGTNSDKTWPFAQESWAAFSRFWLNPNWGTPNDQGCYYTFTLGDADFFVLDSREHRDPPPAANGAAAPAAGGRSMLGAAQLEWLKQGLLKSTANFKIIACGSPLLTNDAAGPNAAVPMNDDAWAAFQPEQGDFLEWLGKQKINGVVFISGTNRGYGELTGIGARQSPTGYPLLELTSSALAGDVVNAVGGAAGAQATVNPARLQPAVVGNNFGTIDFGGDRFHRFVTLRLRDAGGAVKAEQTVSLGQLQGQ